MKNWVVAFSMIGSAFALAGPTVAGDEIIPWKQVGHWDVSIDTTLNGGCFALASFEGDTALRIQWSPEEEELYVLLFDADWTSLQVNKDYELTAKMDSAEAWALTATAIDFNGVPGFAFAATDENFVDEFMRKQTIDFTFNGSSIALLSLAGSDQAFLEIIECQENVDEVLSGIATGDPFKQ